MAVATERLSGQDLANLLVEAPDTPMHMAVLTVFEGAAAAIDEDRLLERLREHFRLRLRALPELRRTLRSEGIPGRRPAWREDPNFRVAEHVRAASIPAPGGDDELYAVAGDLLEGVLDRSRPLWEMWLLTGLRGGRWAALLKVHHSLTDGYGMLQLARVLFDGPAAGAPPEEPSPGVGGALSTALRPLLTSAAVGTTLASVILRTWHGRRAELLRPIGAERRIAMVELDLAEVKRVAHAHAAKVNDVLLELASAGVKAALEGRGAPIRGVVLRALMAVSPSVARRSIAHNRAASIIVSLPLETASAEERLVAIAEDSRRARRWQRSGVIERSMVFVARTRLGRFLSRHQRVVDLAVSNLVGPEQELSLLGDPMVEAIPFTPISGNVTLDFCALSYLGRLRVGLLADRDAWPDLPLVAAGMRAGAVELGLQPA